MNAPEMLTEGGWGAIFVPDKMAFTEQSITGEEAGPLMKIKGSIHQEDIIVLKSYAPNIRITKYIKENPSVKNGQIQQAEN